MAVVFSLTLTTLSPLTPAVLPGTGTTSFASLAQRIGFLINNVFVCLSLTNVKLTMLRVSVNLVTRDTI